MTTRGVGQLPAFPTRPDVVSWWAAIAPERIALVDRTRDRRLTYAELDAASERWARALRKLGTQPGDRVAALAGNAVELLILFGGCLRIGAILVPFNWRLAPPELARVVADAEPRILFGESRFRASAEEALRLANSSVRWIDLETEAPRILHEAAGEPDRPHVMALPDDPTMLLYTSGSTGRPKGVVLPHRQLFFNALATTTGWQLGADDIAPVATPLFHTGGWHVFTTPLLHVGGRVVVYDQFDSSAFLQGLAEEACTVAFAVPTQIAMMTEDSRWEEPRPALRFLISGGAPCPEALAARVRATGMSFRQGFGLTECGPNCFATSAEAAARKPATVGVPIPFLEMRLDGGGGREAEPGEPGELLLRGPQMFAGYFRDETRTAEAVDSDGWLRTGDLAERDADGVHRICGRRKEMFISGGENVFPGEVEAVLADCDGVAEVAVVGIADAKWGEVGRAFIVARSGASLGTEKLIAHARARLAGYKVPRSLVFLRELPRLGSGKVDRAALAATPAPDEGARR